MTPRDDGSRPYSLRFRLVSGKPRGWRDDYTNTAFRSMVLLAALVSTLLLIALLVTRSPSDASRAQSRRLTSLIAANTGGFDTVPGTDAASATTPPAPPQANPDIREPVSTATFTLVTPGAAPVPTSAASTASTASTSPTHPTTAPQLPELPVPPVAIPTLPPIPTPAICAVIKCQ